MELIQHHCLPVWNTSCSLNAHLNYINILLFMYISVMSVLTVCGNLLVILSVIVFKQMHTPANLITLSLAASDFLVGICVMPVESFRSINPCFQMKDFQCRIFHTIMSILGSMSLANILLVAVDRYLAVCYPLQYVSKVSSRKTLACLTLGWMLSVCYNVAILDYSSIQPGATVICLRECAVAVSESRGAADLMISFISPCFVMVIMYVRILAVALKQAKSISSMERHKVSQMSHKQPRKKDMKATKALASIMSLYMICWIPWYIASLNLQHFKNSSSLSALLCLFYTNSCLNPFIYAFFYPWFKRSIKLVVTFQIWNTANKQINFHT